MGNETDPQTGQGSSEFHFAATRKEKSGALFPARTPLFTVWGQTPGLSRVAEGCQSHGLDVSAHPKSSPTGGLWLLTTLHFAFQPLI